MMGSTPKDIAAGVAEAADTLHEVTLSPYCLDRTEVTVRDYRACATQTQHGMKCPDPPKTMFISGTKANIVSAFNQYCNAGATERENDPINCVDWEMANVYCSWAGKSLPTEAQWEFAARGATGKTYPWGESPPAPDLLNACGQECRRLLEKYATIPKGMYAAGDAWSTTSPIGAVAADVSGFGVRDMGGNVNEWTQDWYAPYSEKRTSDPVLVERPPGNAHRVLRGASWLDIDPAWARGARRHRLPPESRSAAVGIRCAISPK